ncbi:MAG: site-2 protease family protein [Candidatus Erginobacter occultus]|nr:site-2 protease family protein [Candidatus Erginobacter occultus]
MDFSQIIIVLPILLFSVIVHEIAHGWTALRCGDPTARDAGRLTFNPIPHIDPFMTIILPLLLIVSGGPVFGGAKPVPVNPYLFRGGERDNVLVSAAGAAANLLLALAAFLLSLVLIGIYRATGTAAVIKLLELLNIVIFINLLLANFNLLPIPPLDGSHILAYFLRGEAKAAYLRFSRYGFMVLIGVIFLGDLLPIPGGLFSLLFAPTFAVRDILFRIQVGFLV